MRVSIIYICSKKTVFILGTVEDAQLQSDIETEAQSSNDVLQATFVDAYRNLTYKHVLGYKY